MIYEGTWFIQNLNFCQKAEKSLNLIICHGWVLSKVLSRLISVCQKVLYNFATECNFQYCIEKPAPSPLLQFTAHQLNLFGVLNLATRYICISKYEKCSYCICYLQLKSAQVLLLITIELLINQAKGLNRLQLLLLCR